ncbi:MAG: hypothetical protein QW474_00790 [Candidatus Aenigmatarchaeota archaeon]|nr:hypothetical protein [Candidatus Aenigmarchaeota archaeon]
MKKNKIILILIIVFFLIIAFHFIFEKVIASTTTTTTTAGTTTQPPTTTSICPSGYTLCTQRKTPYCADLKNDRENCGACGNECEGPIDGGYCCVNGKCKDNTGQSCGYNPSTTATTTSSSTTSTTATSSSTTSTTATIKSPYIIKIKLKGDYNQNFEYSTIYVNDQKIKDVCNENCEVNCNLIEPKDVDEIKNIDIDSYCEKDGYIQVKFVDSTRVDECNSVFEACINNTEKNNEYCCKTECNDENCKNYVAFDCDSFKCIQLSDIDIKKISCDMEKCALTIYRNILNKSSTVFILFFDQDGVVYYQAFGVIEKNFVGKKTFYLNKIKECENQNLEIKINIIDDDKLLLTSNVGEISC